MAIAARIAGEERRCTHWGWDAAERIEARARHPDGRDRPEAAVVEVFAWDVKVMTDDTTTLEMRSWCTWELSLWRECWARSVRGWACRACGRRSGTAGRGRKGTRMR